VREVIEVTIGVSAESAQTAVGAMASTCAAVAVVSHRAMPEVPPAPSTRGRRAPAATPDRNLSLGQRRDLVADGASAASSATEVAAASDP
jgi:hypothetical protein